MGRIKSGQTRRCPSSWDSSSKTEDTQAQIDLRYRHDFKWEFEVQEGEGEREDCETDQKSGCEIPKLDLYCI